MGPRPGPDLPHAWHGHVPETLLGEARLQYAGPAKVRASARPS